MSGDVIKVVDKMGKDEEMSDRIHFSNILKELTLNDLYSDVESQDDNSCASNKSWNMSKDGGQIDQKTIVYNDAVADDKIDDLNEELVLHLRTVW